MCCWENNMLFNICIGKEKDSQNFGGEVWRNVMRLGKYGLDQLGLG
jgi:hypothetical protein